MVLTATLAWNRLRLLTHKTRHGYDSHFGMKQTDFYGQNRLLVIATLAWDTDLYGQNRIAVMRTWAHGLYLMPEKGV